jgi:nucleoside-triphosphatase THEP1
MICILSGAINSGKTAKLEELYNQYFKADGYILKKAYDNGVYIGQNIVRLKNREERPFTRIVSHLPPKWCAADSYIDYSFSLKGLIFARSIINGIIRNETGTAIIDEIGPLELTKRGIYKEFVMLMKYADNIYVTIREECLSDAIELFKFENYIII